MPPPGIISLSPALEGAPEDLMASARERQLEGIVAKKVDSVYEAGERSGAWVKCKAELTGIFIVGGYMPGSHGFDELVLGEREGKGLRFVCRLKAGFVPASRRTVMAKVKPLVQEQCPFTNLPEPKKARWGEGLDADAMKKCRWVKPKIKVEVAFIEWTEGRKLRHARFVSLS